MAANLRIPRDDDDDQSDTNGEGDGDSDGGGESDVVSGYEQSQSVSQTGPGLYQHQSNHLLQMVSSSHGPSAPKRGRASGAAGAWRGHDSKANKRKQPPGGGGTHSASAANAVNEADGSKMADDPFEATKKDNRPNDAALLEYSPGNPDGIRVCILIYGIYSHMFAGNAVRTKAPRTQRCFI